MNLKDVTNTVLQVVGIITVFYMVFKALAKLIDSVDLLYNKVKVKIYYPIAARLSKQEHKKYVETYFNELLFRKPIELPLSFGRVRIEWSDEESVKMDLEENVLLIRVEYASEIEKILAKTAFLMAPYLISEHLEPALGEEFSRLISIGVIESYLQAYPNILAEFRKHIDEIYGAPEYREVLSLISKADDKSLYMHIFLYELRKILERFGSKVDRGKLVGELKELLEVIANLEDIDVPKVCGYYVSLTIVRAGKLEKVAFGAWKPYVDYIKYVSEECGGLQRVYIVSAGKYTTRAAEGLIEYLEKNVGGLSLMDKFEYKARYYKGKTNVPCLVAVMKVE